MFVLAGVCSSPALAKVEVATTPPTTAPSVKKVAVKPAPTHANVAYGPHERNTLDVWTVESDTPVPCVIHIHGGAWLSGDKDTVGDLPAVMLKNGIAVVAINYRYLEQTIIDTGSTHGTGPIQPRANYAEPPVKVPLMDAARAVQYVRSRAAEWNIDPQRIGLTGTSAGGCTSLWLTFHDDLADPSATDPVARQSSKPWCAAVSGPQTTLDPKVILDWIPNATYSGHAFGYVWDKSDHTVELRSFLADREAVLPWINAYSPEALVTPGDPPVFMAYHDGAPQRGLETKDPTHSSAYAAIITPKLEQAGVPYELYYPGIANPRFKSANEYLIHQLKAER